MKYSIFRGCSPRFLKKGRSLFAAALSALVCSTAHAGPPLVGSNKWSVVNNVAQVNGQDFMPLGIYYVSFYKSEDAARLIDIEKVANAGFNMFATPLKLSDKGLLDKAASLGLYTMAEFNYDPTTIINMVKPLPTHSMFLSWDDVDEPNSAGVRLTRDKVIADTTALKAKDPTALTFITAFSNQYSKNYAGIADAYCYQVYPVPNEPLSSVTYNLRLHLAGAAGYSQVNTACLQTYAYSGVRMPTAEEVRNMTYQAFILGMKGMFYYTYYDGGSYLNNYPTLWSGISRVVKEVDSLKPFFLRGARTELSTGNSLVTAAQFLHKGRLMMVVANTTNSSYSINLRPTVPVNTTARNVFLSRPGGLSVVSGALKGVVPARAVMVYELTPSSTTATSGTKTIF
jgi:hypothetical protein